MSIPLGVMAGVLVAAAAATARVVGIVLVATPLAGWFAGSLVRLPVAFALAAHYRDHSTAIFALPFVYLSACLLAAVVTPVAPTAPARPIVNAA
ncbi:MAG: hypothetical protein AAF805_02155 [Planctomycetota bacterium]